MNPNSIEYPQTPRLPTENDYRVSVDIEFPKPARLAETFVYDVTAAGAGFVWPRNTALAVSVPAWYRAVSWPPQLEPRARAAIERRRLRTVLAWASLTLKRNERLSRDCMATRFVVHCVPRMPGIPVLCPLEVRTDRDSRDIPVIAIVTPDAD
jgi:hypothetical protein